MKISGNIKQRIAVLPVLVSLALLCVAMFSQGGAGNTEHVSRALGRRVAARMERLEGYVSKAPARLPEDMVIYRYRDDTLQSWNNRFPINSDNISRKVLVQRLSDPRIKLQSPLSVVSDSLTFLNLGPKWFLLRSYSDGDSKVIAGLEIVNTLDEPSINGVNPRLRLGKRYGIKPLTESEGSEVSVCGTPVFKVAGSVSGTDTAPDAGLVWIAFALLLFSCVLFLESERTLHRLAICLSCAFVVVCSMFLWGRFSPDMAIFSPSLFAGGKVLYSLGAVIIVNLAILICVGGFYLVREDIYSRIVSKTGHISCIVLSLVFIGLICIYVNFALKSIILNSNICLELFQFKELSVWSLVVFLSFLTMLLCVPMLLQMASLSLQKVSGLSPDFFSNSGRIVLSALCAVYLVAITSFLGFEKEQGKVKLWADRLVVDRDIYLEMELREVEFRIDADIFIPSFSFLDNASSTIENLLVDNYLSRIAGNYAVRVFVSNDSSSPQEVAFLNERIRSGVPIADSSHFLYIESSGGAPRYDGVFLYRSDEYGLSRVIVEVESVSGGKEKGYLSIAGISSPGKITIPPPFGYARYRNGMLLSYKGDYAYPTNLGKYVPSRKKNGYLHFASEVSPEEVVIISRPVFSVANYLIEIVFIALVWYLMLSMMYLPSLHRNLPVNGYYKTRVSWVIMASLTLTLIVMATASVVFVYRRNTANLKAMMSERVGALQMMLQEVVKDVENPSDLRSRQMTSFIETVCTNMNSDVTLYAPNGSFLLSTSGEAFSRLIPQSRIDEEAYANIVSENRRFFLRKESLGPRKYYNMYAPLMDGEGRILAILSSPYADMESYDFERDVAMHSVTIFTLFLLLLLIARLAALAIVDMMFKPLSEMGRKMSGADVDSLEFILYDRDDEISSLVHSYNRMVSELKESTRKLAQAERDKAWSGMARQVAHEIKNPLTPMKLQLQRIIRLKEKGDESWTSRFDDVSKLLLGHIDILTDTANEFSTFAKLYTEEPTRIDLDTVLQEEMSMFDNKDNIVFEYRGLQGASVMGPKPQLTRVFVNLINNAVQALENTGNGRILLSLRNSSEDGFYDIVFEDNGPGVAPENRDRLFTPNFTTKNGGSGLGLAISRSILEKCGAVISYQKSFSLGGACFSIKYPKELLSL